MKEKLAELIGEQVTLYVDLDDWIVKGRLSVKGEIYQVTNAKDFHVFALAEVVKVENNGIVLSWALT